MPSPACSSSKAIHRRPWPSTWRSAAPPAQQGLFQPAARAAAGRDRRHLLSGRSGRRRCPTARRWRAMTASPSPAPACTSTTAAPEVTRQIDLVRAALATGTPMFGSCWGLQVITAAAGGSVRKNPKGREIGFGRGIRLTEAGPQASDVCRQARRVQRADRASRRGRDAARRAPPCSPPMRCRRCRAPKSAPTARSPGRCSIIRNIRCARSRRSCAASARG